MITGVNIPEGKFQIKMSLFAGNQPNDFKMLINKGQDDQMEIYYYKPSQVKTALTYVGFILTCGLLRLIYHWEPHLYLYSTCVNCRINEAEKILIVVWVFYKCLSNGGCQSLIFRCRNSTMENTKSTT